MTTEIIETILKATPVPDKLSVRENTRQLQWDKCAEECQMTVASFKRLLTTWSNNVKRKITLRELLMVVLSNPSRYLKKPKGTRLTNAYQVFLKEVVKEAPHIPWAEKMGSVAPRYAALDATQKEKYAEEAMRINIEKGLLNPDGSKPERQKKKKLVSSFFSHPVALASNKRSGRKIATKQITPIKPAVQIKSPDKDGTPSFLPIIKESKLTKNEETVPVNLFECFMEERKSRGLKESRADVQKAFDKLSTKDHLEFTYKVIKAVEVRLTN